MKTKRKPRRRIGTSALLGLLLMAGSLPFVPLSIQAAPKKKPALETYAIVSGSVFNESGYALAGANVTLTPGAQPASSSDKPSGKMKPMQAVSSERGEFAFRVPPGPAQYAVSVSAKGYQNQLKTVSVQDQERVEVTFQLERQSK